MSRKLQVFISSTFNDLREERQAAVEAILLANHIPAGMELFTAGDKSQLDVIKGWISESDVYLLILGARYGSVEPDSGRSYTELEYDFAVSAGMPHFALVLNDSAAERKRSAGLVADDEEKYNEHLSAFRKKVLSKSSSFVDDPRDIKICVLQSLHEIEKRPGLVGWVRPSEIQSVAPLLNQLNILSSENARIRSELEASRSNIQTRELAKLDDAVTITIESKYKRFSSWESKEVKTTWRSLFECIGIKLLAPTNDELLNDRVARFFGAFNADKADPEVRVNERDWETIKAQFLQLGFVEIKYAQTVVKTGALFWTLTQLGKQVALALRAK